MINVTDFIEEATGKKYVTKLFNIFFKNNGFY